MDTVRVRLDLSYDGTGFVGWAAQPGLRSVEDDVQRALATVLRLPEPPRLTCAGRTDSGVHARGQVAHVDLPAPAWGAAPGRGDRPPGAALVRRLAGVLPDDVVVHDARPAPAGFDARFSAVWRRYAFRVVDDVARRDPLARSRELWHRRPLDVGRMDVAARLLEGEHDFLAYCKPREGATTVRTLLEHRWTREPDGLLIAHVRADAFCHSMVRALVGACLAVGEGRWPAERPRELLDAVARTDVVQVAPAHGLTLEEVRYPDDADLAARAEQARATRTLTPGGPHAVAGCC